MNLPESGGDGQVSLGILWGKTGPFGSYVEFLRIPDESCQGWGPGGFSCPPSPPGPSGSRHCPRCILPARSQFVFTWLGHPHPPEVPLKSLPQSREPTSQIGTAPHPAVTSLQNSAPGPRQTPHRLLLWVQLALWRDTGRAQTGTLSSGSPQSDRGDRYGHWWYQTQGDPCCA